MTQAVDLVAYNPERELTLVVEVKARTGTSREWAMQLRRNMLAHHPFPKSRYMLLALPDHFYLWKDADPAAQLVDPTYELDVRPFLRSYYDEAETSADRISGSSFELIIFFCLTQLLHRGLPPDAPEDQKQFFLESGLLEALKNGRIEAGAGE